MKREERINHLIKKYFKQVPDYVSFGESLVKVIKNLLHESNISFLSTEYRVKNVEQFIEKINRKNYQQPFEEMTDICGVRVICYFHRDVEQIISLIKNTFEIVEEVDKNENEDPTKFGYRSKHLIIKIPEFWSSIPIFKKLDNFKAEVQVRTVLMHAWAEIEHKLAYKKQSHIPKHLRRKFSRLSAKLEEADEQFEELIDDIMEYKMELDTQIAKDKGFSRNTSLNLDTLQAFFDFYMPYHVKDIKETRAFLDEALEKGINMQKLIGLFEIEKKHGGLKKTENTQKKTTQRLIESKR